jgi:hypothetical protein
MTYFDNKIYTLEKKITPTNKSVPITPPLIRTKVLIDKKTKEKTSRDTARLVFPILGGVCGMLLSSYIWIESYRILKEHYQYDHKYAYMALLVSLSVGLLMRWAGAKSSKLAIISVLLTFVGSLLGTLLSVLVHFAKALGLNYFEVFNAFDFSFLFFLLKDRFAYLDIIFYLASASIAYWLVKSQK